jgi:Fe-Mn family superoxide dismutase
VAERIRVDFGSYERFVERLVAAAITQFGSGWAWLVLDVTGLQVVQTSNADTPLRHDKVPLLTIDVWEHAYYVDYRNRRDTYVKAIVEHLLDWDFADTNLKRASASASGRIAPGASVVDR